MIAVNPNQNELTATEQDIVDQIWQREEQLAAPSAVSGDVANMVASDFVSFDAQGNTVAKHEYVDQLNNNDFERAGITRLWAHFGSENSCCLAYMREAERTQPDICMALWIERDGAWQKTFHHQNAKFG